ncbi:putative metal ion transporter c17a12.14 [Acrodontium crateriforme]|uniref:Metal ion transporter c17a12.14 n=1 Tax=Acrodontium crateriforme TaxID=150365 RepID=A0AAQ3M1W8_9PEZI|nr:putative metal ion transporter c17a12.14 [Acrodontium crateriforme]
MSTRDDDMARLARTATNSTNPNSGAAAPKKKKHRAGKKKKSNRRQSFAAPSETTEDAGETQQRPNLLNLPSQRTQNSGFYRLQTGQGSNSSLASEALLDHREHDSRRARRQSVGGFGRPSLSYNARHRSSTAATQTPALARSRLGHAERAISEDEEDHNATDRTPLLGGNAQTPSKPGLSRSNSGIIHGSHGTNRQRRGSVASKASSRRRVDIASRNPVGIEEEDENYDVNNPPSVPGSPRIGSLDDIMISDLDSSAHERGRDAVITIDDDENDGRRYSSSSPGGMRRRPTVADLAEMDVCFPGDGGLSEIGEDEEQRRSTAGSTRSRRRRTRQWPDLEILDEWSREEKEERTHQELIRSKKIKEPAMVGGRLRASKTTWHREVAEAPFRFTYFNELFDGTIHAQTISDLLQDGATFEDLFRPEPAELSDDSDDEENPNALERPHHGLSNKVQGGQQSNGAPSDVRSPSVSKSNTGTNTPSGRASHTPTLRPSAESAPKRYGSRPTFWLDVLNPTDMEMKVISKAFGIHQLTTEDILMEEPREKVELFSNYYFVNYRSFEQDKDDEDYMEPVNMYVVVFRDGVITFHQTMTPHPANVRRRIRQLNDYMSPTADWISYAIIDDVTDVYAPLVEQIEAEVDQIDDDILYMHTAPILKEHNPKSNSQSDVNDGGDMLRRVGECRKKVMGLYRLLGNKADVIKGFAKRCNEQWEVAPRSEIGLYLGDIQDHIVTMTGNLSHYENLLSRAHSNYLAQINIRMNERAEQTADILGKLTVVGTIVLPMNIITGMWGMNVWVPGQDIEDDLTWFWSITAGLVAFGLTSYFVAKKVYGIV